jgi:hypothetical protein
MVPLILASAAAGILRNLLNQKDPTAVQRLYEEALERGLRAALGSKVGEVTVCGVEVREILAMLNKKANLAEACGPRSGCGNRALH